LVCEIRKLGARHRTLQARPQEKATTPDLPQFARAVVQLASNEALLRRVVDAVACGDGDDFRAALAELKLTEFCHLLCHWVYFITYRRVCEVVCSPERVVLEDAANEVRAAARAVSELLRNESALQVIGKAAINLDCITIRSQINEAGFQPHCEIICWLVCTWRCVWVCRQLCLVRPPVLAGVDAIDEARAFALASRPFANKPRGLTDLVTAVAKNDASLCQKFRPWGLGPIAGRSADGLLGPLPRVLPRSLLLRFGPGSPRREFRHLPRSIPRPKDHTSLAPTLECLGAADRTSPSMPNCSWRFVRPSRLGRRCVSLPL
jgi:hypothetical protein